MSRGPLLVLAAATLWGSTGTAQALGPDGISPETVGFVRMIGGTLLLAYAAATGRAGRVRDLPRVPLFMTMATMASSQPLFFEAVDRTGVAIGTIVTIGSGPLFAGLLAWLIRGERVGSRWYVATSISIVGAVLMVSGGEAAGIDPTGVTLALVTGVIWALYLLSAKAIFDSADAVFAHGVVFVGAAVLLSPVLFLSDVSWMATGRGVLVILWLAPITTGVSYVFFARGLQGTSVAVAATMTLAEPLTATLLGLFVLDEPARFSTVGGIALIVIGLIVLSRSEPAPAGR